MIYIEKVFAGMLNRKPYDIVVWFADRLKTITDYSHINFLIFLGIYPKVHL